MRTAFKALLQAKQDYQTKVDAHEVESDSIEQNFAAQLKASGIEAPFEFVALSLKTLIANLDPSQSTEATTFKALHYDLCEIEDTYTPPANGYWDNLVNLIENKQWQASIDDPLDLLELDIDEQFSYIEGRRLDNEQSFHSNHSIPPIFERIHQCLETLEALNPKTQESIETWRHFYALCTQMSQQLDTLNRPYNGISPTLPHRSLTVTKPGSLHNKN